MGTILFITFVVVPILEIALFMEIGDRIGLGATISIIILTAIIGTFLIRHQGIATLKKAQDSLQKNRLPIDEAFDGLCIIFAGVLLLTQANLGPMLGVMDQAVTTIPMVVLAAGSRTHQRCSIPAQCRIELANQRSAESFQLGPLIV